MLAMPWSSKRTTHSPQKKNLAPQDEGQRKASKERGLSAFTKRVEGERHLDKIRGDFLYCISGSEEESGLQSILLHVWLDKSQGLPFFRPRSSSRGRPQFPKSEIERISLMFRPLWFGSLVWRDLCHNTESFRRSKSDVIPHSSEVVF